MTAETHEEAININENSTINKPDTIDESWALMLLLDNETDLINNCAQKNINTRKRRIENRRISPLLYFD